MSLKTEEREFALDGEDEVREVRRVEVVDLTVSDSDGDEGEGEGEDGAGVDAGSPHAREPPATAPSHNPTALLTPLATVLKSDRLGIGLKARTVGSYKESKKRVTHNQAALAAHARTTEEMRLRKAVLGRGTRSFARAAKADAEARRQLLASLNAD